MKKEGGTAEQCPCGLIIKKHLFDGCFGVCVYMYAVMCLCGQANIQCTVHTMSMLIMYTVSGNDILSFCNVIILNRFSSPIFIWFFNKTNDNCQKLGVVYIFD